MSSDPSLPQHPGDVVRQLDEARAEVTRLETAIRTHRDQRGDDRCWIDDLSLYAALPEGHAGADLRLHTPDEMLANCKRYIASRQPDTQAYVSPQREIERLTTDLSTLRARLPQWAATCGDPCCPCLDGDACHYMDRPGSPAMVRPIDRLTAELATVREERDRARREAEAYRNANGEFAGQLNEVSQALGLGDDGFSGLMVDTAIALRRQHHEAEEERDEARTQLATLAGRVEAFADKMAKVTRTGPPHGSSTIMAEAWALVANQVGKELKAALAASPVGDRLDQRQRKTVEKVRSVLSVSAIESDTAVQAALAQMLAIIDALAPAPTATVKEATS